MKISGNLGYWNFFTVWENRYSRDPNIKKKGFEIMFCLLPLAANQGVFYLTNIWNHS